MAVIFPYQASEVGGFLICRRTLKSQEATMNAIHTLQLYGTIL